MLPDDVFRSRLQTTITALRYWAPSVADAARLDEDETSDLTRKSTDIQPRQESSPRMPDQHNWSGLTGRAE